MYHLFVPYVVSCQTRVTVTSCFVYKNIRDLESIDHFSINPIHILVDKGGEDTNATKTCHHRPTSDTPFKWLFS